VPIEGVEKAVFNSSSKNLLLIFGGGWVGVKQIIHAKRTLKVGRTQLLHLFQHPHQ
jgi:hypothetical protein